MSREAGRLRLVGALWLVPRDVIFLNAAWQDTMPAYQGRADLIIADPVYESADLS
ncbi:MAG: hypothetical protein ACLP0J_25560 [Solirubrobacteraceae bacterium]